jgi:hypothetical protein
VYDISNSLIGYFRFNVDTASNSLDNINYSNVSTYFESGINFTIVDLPGSGSTCFDTGHYTFSIQSDTLNFTLVNDPCIANQRPLVLVDFHWVRLSTDITESPLLQNRFTVYPNPFNNQTVLEFSEIQNGTTIKITDINGRIVRKVDFDGKQFILEKGDMNSGIYFVLIEAENKITSFKKIIIH